MTTETRCVPGTGLLTFDCETCARHQQVSLEDPDAFIAAARSFFISHRSCRTVIDLSDTRYEGWRVP
jgi:hypothetical protein